MLDSDFFSANRERLRELFTGTAPIVVTANGMVQKGADEAYPFHQDANFWYLTGISEPDIVLVIDKNKEYLIVPGRSDSREVFDGAIDSTELARLSGITTVLSEKEGWKQLEGRLQKVNHVATLAAPPAYVESWGMYTNPAREVLIARLRAGNGELEMLDLRSHLARLRMIKQPQELDMIRRAIDVTIDTLKDVTKPKQLVKYAHEYELEADITRGFRMRGASGHAFSPIVASGKHACTLHHVHNDGLLASNELIVLDIGAEWSHYAADITRTVISGTPSTRQQAVYDAVLSVQNYAFSLLKPGIVFQDYEEKIMTYMGEKLRELGLIKTINEESVRHYFPHATSHFLGLNTHDVGDYERPLEPGVVMTVEPGIYIPEEGIGVRIEDDVLITGDGIEVLSEKLPRTLVSL
jgi:Xaa-Pro aminopeptidase